MSDYRELPSSRILISMTLVSLLAAISLSIADRMLLSSAPAGEHADPHAAMAANLQQTMLVQESVQADFRIPGSGLQATNGIDLTEQLAGKWSLVFFGFTSCPHICPTTLASLARMADLPDSGFADGNTQVLFISVDPETDNLARVSAYLAGFDERFVGYTGESAALKQVADAIGAAFSTEEGGIDHSTSVFVMNPSGQPAGVLLRPGSASGLRDDLLSLQRHAALRAGQVLAGSD